LPVLTALPVLTVLDFAREHLLGSGFFLDADKKGRQGAGIDLVLPPFLPGPLRNTRTRREVRFMGIKNYWSTLLCIIGQRDMGIEKYQQNSRRTKTTRYYWVAKIIIFLIPAFRSPLY